MRRNGPQAQDIHTVDYGPFIKSLLAVRHVEGLANMATFGANMATLSPESGVNERLVQSTYPNTGYRNTYLPSTHTPSAGPRRRKYAEGWTP